MLRVGLRPLYRRALGHPNARVIFQNDDDRQRVGTICPGLGDRMRMIRGSGVDLEAFAPGPEPEGPVTVVLPARPLTAKGIAEFAGAARMLKAGGVEARFALVGDAPATTPTRVPEGQLARWRDEGAIELWGHRDDMAGVLRQAHIVALPSYREGMPKALLEAAASGLPSVTSDCPGCRDAVIAGETGLLVPPRDAGALATALERLIGDPALRRRMGAAARAHAERHFSVETVVAAHLEIYRDLLGTSGAGSCAA